MRPTKAARRAHNRGGGRGRGAERASASTHMRGQIAHYYEYLLVSVEYSSAALFKPTHLMILEDGP